MQHEAGPPAPPCGAARPAADKLPVRAPVIELLDPQVVESLRRLTPGEKLQRAFAMWDFARSVMIASIRQDHPEWNAAEIQAEVLRRLDRKLEP